MFICYVKILLLYLLLTPPGFEPILAVHGGAVPNPAKLDQNHCSCFIFYLPYLSSIHEKAIFHYVLDGKSALAWELLFPGHLSSIQRWGVPLSALHKDTTSKLAGLFATTSHKCQAPSREAIDTIFKVFWYDSTKGMNGRSTDCEADALTTMLTRRFSKRSQKSLVLLVNHFFCFSVSYSCFNHLHSVVLCYLG